MHDLPNCCCGILRCHLTLWTSSQVIWTFWPRRCLGDQAFGMHWTLFVLCPAPQRLFLRVSACPWCIPCSSRPRVRILACLVAHGHPVTTAWPPRSHFFAKLRARARAC